MTVYDAAYKKLICRDWLYDNNKYIDDWSKMFFTFKVTNYF